MTFSNFCQQHNVSLVLHLQKKIIINVISQVGSCMNISFACHHANTCTRNAYICNWYNKTVEAHTFLYGTHSLKYG